MTRRYGQWAGNPTGTPEDPARCVMEVWRSMYSHQCLRPRGHGPLGEYCAQHAKRVLDALRGGPAGREATPARKHGLEEVATRLWSGVDRPSISFRYPCVCGWRGNWYSTKAKALTSFDHHADPTLVAPEAAAGAGNGAT